MASYGLKYRAEWRNTRNQDYRLDIYRRGYTGGSKTIKTLCGCSLEIQGAQDGVFAPIIKTQLRFSVIDAWDIAETSSEKWGSWSEFYTPDATLYKVQVLEYSGGSWTAIWTGYITPDSWQEDLGYRTAITITARDNIGHLKDFFFEATGDAAPDINGLIEVRNLISRAMAVIDFPMTFAIESAGSGQYSADVPCTADGDYLTEALVNADLFDGMDWYAVLEQSLEAIGYAFRYVGGNKCVVGCLRNLPKMGHYTSAVQTQTLEFYGGNMEFEPAVKQIEDKIDFKFQEEVPLEVLDDFQFTTGSAYRCKVEGNDDVEPLVVHSAPLDILTNPGMSVWDNGSEMFNPNTREPDSYLINSEGADGWKQYAMIPGNRETEDPSTSFRFHTKTAAVRVSINFAPFPIGLISSGMDQGKVTALQYSLSEIDYQVSYESDDGNTVRYWTGSGWADDHAHTIVREYDSENEYGTALEIPLAECREIGRGELVITFANIIYKRWDDEGIGVYARVQSILVGVISTRGITGDKVTTINNTAYNINVSRQPLFGALSKDVGFTKPANYLAGLFYYPFVGSSPEQFPYMVRFTDQGATVPLPVLTHQQILCYRYGAARVLGGRCAPVNKGVWDPRCLFVYKGVTYLLQGGNLDLFSGIMEGAVLHEFIDFNELWTGTPTYNQSTSYNTDTPGTGHSGGNSGGSPGGGGGGGSVTSVAMTVPAGMTIGGSPITAAGTLALGLDTGRTIPTASDVNKGVAAYNWGDHSEAGYADASEVSAGFAAVNTALNGKQAKINDLATIRSNAEEGATAYSWGDHSEEGYIKSVSLASGTNNGTLKLTVDGVAVDNIAVTGLGSLAFKSSLAASDIPDLSGDYLPITGGTLTGDLRLKNSGNYGLRIRFGDGDYAYIHEDSDDHLRLHASNGFTFSAGSGKGIETDTFLDIGNARLIYDSTNKALRVTKKDGTTDTISLYADGDVAAGGVGSGVTVKYVNCANQTAYNNISTKDPSTIYTVGIAPSFSRVYLGTILLYSGS